MSQQPTPLTDACYVRAGMMLAAQVDELDACSRDLERKLSDSLNAHAVLSVENAELRRKVKETNEELAEKEKDYMALARHLDGHDVAECVLNLRWMKRRLKAANEALERVKNNILTIHAIAWGNDGDCGVTRIADRIDDICDEALATSREVEL